MFHPIKWSRRGLEGLQNHSLAVESLKALLGRPEAPVSPALLAAALFFPRAFTVLSTLYDTAASFSMWQFGTNVTKRVVTFGSFSAVSAPIFSSKYAFCISFQLGLFAKILREEADPWKMSSKLTRIEMNIFRNPEILDDFRWECYWNILSAQYLDAF